MPREPRIPSANSAPHCSLLHFVALPLSSLSPIKSKRCKKIMPIPREIKTMQDTPGVGVNHLQNQSPATPLNSTSKGTTMPANNNAHLLCQHLTKAGHHCHMPLSAGHQSLCTHHLHIAKREAVRHAETAASQRDDSADLSALFSTDLPKQKSAADIHTHLWNLSLALQQGRISPRRAAVLAYISSLLLRTLPAIEKKEHP